MLALKTLDRTPSLAELKVSYRRGKPKNTRPGETPQNLRGPIDAEKYLRSIWDRNRLDWQEDFLLVCLNTAHEILGWVRVATGGMDSVAIDPRHVFGVALQTASAAIVVAHNHPSGNCEASSHDQAFTKRLKAAGELLDIPLLDHIILTRDGYFSFSEAGML